MNGFEDELESLFLVTTFSEFSQNVEHIEKMLSSEYTFFFEFLYSVVDSLFLISDDNRRCFSHNAYKRLEDIRVGKDRLTIRDYKPINCKDSVAILTGYDP